MNLPQEVGLEQKVLQQKHQQQFPDFQEKLLLLSPRNECGGRIFPPVSAAGHKAEGNYYFL